MDKDYACGEYSEIKDWTQIRVTVRLPQLDSLTALMSMVNNNLMIEDYSDIDLKSCYGDLIDESILNADKSIASVSVFLPSTSDIGPDLDFIRDRMAADGIEGKIELVGHSENDWANSWKSYYKPIRIGSHMVIVPQWESYEPGEGDIIVTMDPGMAFGTGTHETTRLVIGLLEKYVKPHCRVLDVGCGSGILAICAAKLGARLCRAYDIDPLAVRVAGENIAVNGVSDIVSCEVSDLLRNVSLEGGRYDVVCANIVADIIIRMSPDVAKYIADGGVMIASGIITTRAADVEEALVSHGLKVVDRAEENGWCALVLSKQED